MEYAHLLRLFLNRYILKLPIKTQGQMPLHVKVEITHYDEMNDKMFDVDIDIAIGVWDNARNVIEPISFHRFHTPSNWLAYFLWGGISLIDS
jgi:hypothetical protein